MAQQAITVFLILAAIGFTVVANLVLKLGASSAGIAPIWPLSIVNFRVIAAAASFSMAFMFYTMLLRRMPLSIAQAILSLQFVFVVLAANVILNEEIGPARWAGIALMALGLGLIGLSPSSGR